MSTAITHKTDTIVESYKKNMCSLCMYVASCNRGLYPVYDEQTEITTLKCEYYGRYNNELENE